MRIISPSTFEFICVDHLNLDKWPDLKVVCSTHIGTTVKEHIFPLRVFVNWRQPLLSGWESFLLSHFGTGTQLVWTFAGHMHDATSEWVQKSVLFCVEHSVSLLSLILIGSYNFFSPPFLLKSLKMEGRNLRKASHLAWSLLMSFI